MSIIISDLSFHYPNQPALFSHLNFSVGQQEKASIVGNNGTGKSTLLKIIAQRLQPAEGRVSASSLPYYIPQHTGLLAQSVAEALGIHEKLAALHAIENGSLLPSHYDTLADDWDIEAKYQSALAYWQLPPLAPDTPADKLSGGEKTKLFLAGLLIHTPGIILLDEPSNHLDQTGRDLLYRYISQSDAAIVVVSHDITLLNQIETTYELSGHGIRLYGGNYSFYKAQKELETHALSEDIREQEKAIRLARKKAREVRERQEKRSSQGEKRAAQQGGPRILLNAKGGMAENTAARLKGKHSEILGGHQNRLAELRQQQERMEELKIDFDNTSLHTGKLLVEATGLNFAYPGGAMLWQNPVDFKLFSNDRIHLSGDNGRGKTTFIHLLTGSLTPSEGSVRRADFNWIYLDQNYTRVDVAASVEELAEQYNHQHLAEHEIKIRLNRFLFPSDSWNKSCKSLSGGERMRLYLCCLMISNQTPDLIILDEPTNNLDISSLQILTATMKNYKGSLLVVSHDRYFVSEIGADREFVLTL